MSKLRTKTIWTLANVITLVRILFVPIFLIIMLCPWPKYMDFWPEANVYKPWIAALVFLLLSLTDKVDGYLARSRGEVNDFGKFADPLADKILTVAALLALIELKYISSWPVLIIIVREFMICGLRMYAASREIIIAASFWGKAKTVFLCIAILLFIVSESSFILFQFSSYMYFFSWFVMSIALILTIASMIDYIYKCRDLFKV